MRITTVIGSVRCGGAERVCVNLANAWAAGGRRVTLLTVAQRSAAPAYAVDPRVEVRDAGWRREPRPDELETAALAPVLRGIYRTGRLELFDQLSCILILRRAIAETSPDVVVSHIDLTNIRVLAALEGTRVPVIACEHCDASRVPLERYQQAREAFYRRARAVVAPHPHIADWLARRGAQACAIHSPLSAPPTPGRERSGGPRQRGARRRLVSLSRLAPEKRLDLLVRAFARIAGDFPEWELDVYGDGPLRARLTRLAEELAPGRVRFRSVADDAYAVLGGADLFVSTSWVESFGCAIWEALACGVPVVVTDCGVPVRSLVRDGVDGLLVREGGAAALASALASLMGDDAARAAMSERAPEVLGRFSMRSALRAWDALLDDAARPGAGKTA
ncbi:MAG TPA: glycosyltransferase [Pyrinomonadaceae bacterium]|jgi:glycosyltransferase involved in cell wall biosynthesis